MWIVDFFECIAAQCVSLVQHQTCSPDTDVFFHMPSAHRCNPLFPQVAKLLKAKEKYKEVTGNDFAPPTQKKTKSTPKAQVRVDPNAKPAQLRTTYI